MQSKRIIKIVEKEDIKAQEEAIFALLEDRIIFCGNIDEYPHCKNSRKLVNNLATN